MPIQIMPPTQTSPDRVAAASSKKRKTAESSTNESSSDDDGNVDESSVEESPPSCICNVWIGGNKMCRLHGHLFEQWIADLPPPADFKMGRPRTPPPKKSSTTAVSASNVIDLISDSNGSSKNPVSKNLAAAFEDVKEAKTTRIDVMLKKATQHRRVSSPTFDDDKPRTVESADRFALKCYLSKYSHLKNTVSIPTTKVMDAAATTKNKTVSKKKTASKKKSTPKEKSVPNKKPAAKKTTFPRKSNVIAASKAAAALEVIDVDEDDILAPVPFNKTAKSWMHYKFYKRSVYQTSRM